MLGRSQSGFHSTLQSLRVLRDEDTIVAARAAAEQLLDARRTWLAIRGWARWCDDPGGTLVRATSWRSPTRPKVEAP